MTNKKDYLNGLGTGIILVSTLFFIFIHFLWPSPSLTKDESDPLYQDKNNQLLTSEKVGDNHQLSGTVEGQQSQEENNKDDSNNKELENDTKVTEEGKEGITETNIEDPSISEPKMIHVVIPEGYTSGSVSKILMNYGVIDDYKSFDDYCVINKKDRAIKSGVYELPEDGSFEDILNVIAP